MQDLQHKKKICFVITKGVWGGAQKYVYSLATSIPKDQYDVLVITGAGDVLKHKLEEQNIKTYEVGDLKRNISLFSEIKSFISIFKIIKKERPDILHLNSPKASGLGSVAGRILNLLGIGHWNLKIIQTVHGWTFNENRGVFSKIIILFFSWITLLLCHKTIVIAVKERKQVLKMPFSKQRIVLIKNGAEPISFIEKTVARETLSAICGNQMSTEPILWLGTISELHKNKGLEYTLSAVSKITTPFVFFIIGTGEEKERLEKIIKQNHLENKVFLVGFLDNANQYLKAFDIFTLTSIKEGLPYTLLEAGLAKLPVIASSVGGIPDIIENNVSGILTEKTNIGQITKAIEFMINNPNERNTFGLKLQEKVEKEFSLEQMLNKTTELYRF